MMAEKNLPPVEALKRDDILPYFRDSRAKVNTPSMIHGNGPAGLSRLNDVDQIGIRQHRPEMRIHRGISPRTGRLIGQQRKG